MDQECDEFEPFFLSSPCELLSNVRQPSFSSINESLNSNPNLSHNKEDSFSDTEAMHNMSTSTPQRNSMNRRSVSLVDVSKIEVFGSRLLNSNQMASWETMGSESSVGKSRDSGYIHSGSLLSISSAKLSDLKSSQINKSIMEECERLKKELEYNEILINTLQESNNQLRLKCAAANNRIFELRLKCENHCHSCSKLEDTSAVPDPNMSTQSLSLDSSDSSSSSRSRSSSPHSRFCTGLDVHHNDLTEVIENDNNILDGDNSSCDRPKSSFNKLEQLPEIDTKNQLIPDLIIDQGNPEIISRNNLLLSTKRREDHLDEAGQNFNPEHEDIYLEIHKSETDNNVLTESSKEKMNALENLSINDVDSDDKSIKCHKLSSTSLIDTFLENEVKDITTLDDKSLFVANKMDGSIWVGSFKAWRDSSIKVTPVNKVPWTSTSNKMQIGGNCEISSTPKCNDSLNDTSSDIALNSSISFKSIKPMSVKASLINRSNISQTSEEPNFSEIQNLKYKNQANSKTILKNDKICISVKPISEGYQSRNLSKNSLPIPSLSLLTRNNDKSCSCSSGECSMKKPVTNMNGGNNSRPVNTAQSNLSNLGVSVSLKCTKNVNSELNKSDELKPKFRKISPFGPVLSNNSDLSSRIDVNKSTSPCQAKSLHLKPGSSLTDNLTSSHQPQDLINVKDDTDEVEHQSMAECLESALRYAEWLKQKISKMPRQLEYIHSIGRIET